MNRAVKPEQGPKAPPMNSDFSILSRINKKKINQSEKRSIFFSQQALKQVTMRRRESVQQAPGERKNDMSE